MGEDAAQDLRGGHLSLCRSAFGEVLERFIDRMDIKSCHAGMS